MSGIDKKKIKISFLGTSEFAAKILEFLNNSENFEIVCVITQPDKPSGRKNQITPPPVKVIAAKFDLPIFQPIDLNELEEILQKSIADFTLVIGFGMILTKRCLNLPGILPINVHASLLPRYRGASPIQAALLSGDKKTGVSIMRMTEKLDGGPVYAMKEIPILKNDDITSLSERMIEDICKMLPPVLKDIKSGKLQAVPQNEDGKSYCRKIDKSFGMIDWKRMSARKILNMMRAYKLWPSVFAEIRGKRVKILGAEATYDHIAHGKMLIRDMKLIIGTRSGSLLITKVQPEGKNPMAICDYINGYLK